MGTINFSIREFYDGASELVGIKSGILLNRFKISNFLQEQYNQEYLLDDNLDNYIRIRSDTMTNMVIFLRQKLGNLPEKLPVMNDYLILRNYSIQTKDIMVSGLPSYAFHLIESLPQKNDIEIIQQIMSEDKVDEKIARAAYNIGLYMIDTSLTRIDKGKIWDSATPLSDLFEMETKPKNVNDFIEQKFIDYLAANGHEIESIYWRNFERFCAEYFKRLGYYAVLGPGTNDGGIDIRVYPNSDDLKTTLILVQCKRYSNANKVTIETVKSFYTDVAFEGAKEGIIATTGYIATGGKKVVKARKYNIRFSERENIKQWANQMKTDRTCL